MYIYTVYKLASILATLREIAVRHFVRGAVINKFAEFKMNSYKQEHTYSFNTLLKTSTALTPRNMRENKISFKTTKKLTINGDQNLAKINI